MTTWDELLKQKSVSTHKTSAQELNSLRALVERDLADASIKELSPDRSFGISYQAVLILSKMVLAASGYRAKGHGAHQATITGVRVAMGEEIEDLATYFDACRKKRNQLTYDVAGSVSHAEAKKLLSRAREFESLVETWLSANHPELI
jgi:uncharacterized protein (UPF0332 family)